MNPIVAALIGVIVTLITYHLAGKIGSKVLRGVAQLASVLGSVALVGLLCANPQSATVAGQYYFGGIIAAYILGKLFGGSAKES